MSQFWYEARFALRSLLRRPGFASIAVLTVALGIGANAAIFSVVNGILLKPLPYHDPEGLVSVSVFREDGSFDLRDAMSHPDITDLLGQSPALATLVGYDDFNVTLGGAGEPALVQVARVTDGLMETFLVAPEMGRDIRAEECGPGAPRIAVISYGLWQNRFGMATDILDETIEINGRAYRIVGVASEDFHFPSRTQLWIPHRVNPENCGRACHTWYAVGRLTPGTAVASSQAEADTIGASLAETYPGSNTDKGFRVESLQDVVVGGVRTPLWILLAAVTAVLLIACANMANLLLIRASARTGEVAVRAALGASRGRLTGQLLMESAILALAGGALGLLIATGGVALLRLTSAGTLPRVGDITVDSTVFFFTLGLVILLTLFLARVLPLFLPGFPSRRISITPDAALKEGGWDDPLGVFSWALKLHCRWYC